MFKFIKKFFEKKEQSQDELAPYKIEPPPVAAPSPVEAESKPPRKRRTTVAKQPTKPEPSKPKAMKPRTPKKPKATEK
jgi:hypothetical protein